MMAHGGFEVQFHPLLTSVLERGQLHALAALPPGEETPSSQLNRRMDGPQGKCRQVGEEKYLLSWLVQPRD